MIVRGRILRVERELHRRRWKKIQGRDERVWKRGGKVKAVRVL